MPLSHTIVIGGNWNEQQEWAAVWDFFSTRVRASDELQIVVSHEKFNVPARHNGHEIQALLTMSRVGRLQVRTVGIVITTNLMYGAEHLSLSLTKDDSLRIIVLQLPTMRHRVTAIARRMHI